jgi:CARDB
MRVNSARRLFVGIVSALLATCGAMESAALTSPSDGVRVDFGPAGHEIQERHVDWNNSSESKTFTELDGFAATIKRVDGTTGVNWRDRGDATIEIGNLIEDQVVSSAGLRLTFTNLKAGAYQVKTWHHDVTTSQGTIDIFVTDADGSNRQVANELATTQTAGNLGPASNLLSLRSNGSNAVFIRFVKGASPGVGVPLNGFRLTRHPVDPPARVDFGATGQQLQSQWVAWTNSGSQSFRDLQGFSATIRRADGTTGVQWFDRGDVTHPLGNLVEDGVLQSAGLRLTLSGLKAGRYSIITYHHDATTTQGTIDISVTDASRTNALVRDEVRVGKGTSNPTLTTASFEFSATGSSDVLIFFRRGSGGGNPLINGFDLSRRLRDLTVAYIERTPRYSRYAVTYTNRSPTIPAGLPSLCSSNVEAKRWPDSGEVVTYTGHVRNVGFSPTTDNQYQWRVNGAVAATGALPNIAAGGEVTIAFQHAFSTARIELAVDTNNTNVELDETNNALAIGTRDLTLSIFVERGLYDIFKDTTSNGQPSSFEGWINSNIATMNQRFAQSQYPGVAPNGILDRVRIDKLAVIDDWEALLVNQGDCVADTDDPHKLLIDGRWNFSDGPGANLIGQSWNWHWFHDYVSALAGRIDWGLIHELAHQLGLIDEYRMNLKNDPSANNGFHVLDSSGSEIPASTLPLYDAFDQIVFQFPGLMTGGDTRPYMDGTFFSNHSAGGMNSHAGHRRGYFGEYLWDTPDTTHLQLSDQNGVILTGRPVQIFQQDAATGIYDNVPEITGMTDGQGRLLLPNRSVTGAVTATGHRLRANPFGQIDVLGRNGAMFIRATSASDQPLYAFVFVIDLNLAYWSGHRISTLCTLNLVPPKAEGGSTPSRPQIVCQAGP